MLRSLGAVLLLAVVAGADARADARQAQFVVQAIVPARATLLVVEQPTRLEVSQADIDRGYLEVSARYVVETNAPQGWLLRLSPRVGLARHVEVRGLSDTLIVQDDGVEVFRPRTGRAEPLDLDYRLVLAAEAQPGTYDMPVHVAATPL